MKGIIFDIQKFSIHDGPGIRTTVFLKGCPLRCIWCHNPESQEGAPQIVFKKGNCTNCRACAAVCKASVHKWDETGNHIVDLKACQGSKECVEVCAYNALKVIGREVSVEEVIAEVEKDKAFYENSGGGVTISGGEPMHQLKFTTELLKTSKQRGIHTCMETSGYAPRKSFQETLPLVDLFLYDYKATGEELHKRLTGVSNSLILSNLSLLAEKGARIILRCPLIPGINDQREHLEKIVELSKEYNAIEMVEILPYHDYGKGKWLEIGQEYELMGIHTADEKTIESWRQQLLELGCEKLV